jgi:hypothetical protein
VFDTVQCSPRARGHHRQQRDRPIRGYSRSALAAIEGGDLKIWYVHTTLSEAAATRDEERRTRLLLALAGLGKLVQLSVTAAPNGPKGGAVPRSHCATRRTGALNPAALLP